MIALYADAVGIGMHSGIYRHGSATRWAEVLGAEANLLEI